jgi:hypothetical protein
MKPEEARKWAELYTAIADGKTWQIQSSAGEWNDATNGVHDPRGWSIERLRIKPEPRHVYVATWFDSDGGSAHRFTVSRDIRGPSARIGEALWQSNRLPH